LNPRAVARSGVWAKSRADPRDHTGAALHSGPLAPLAGRGL